MKMDQLNMENNHQYKCEGPEPYPIPYHLSKYPNAERCQECGRIYEDPIHHNGKWLGPGYPQPLLPPTNLVYFLSKKYSE